MSVKTEEEVSAQVPAEDFQALEEKVYRTIELFKATKEAMALLGEEIRTRVEKMLAQMETLAHEPAAS